MDAEESDKAGQLTFEGLGTVLHRLGVFQNLEFIPKDNHGEKSSLHINQAKIKPERLNKEVRVNSLFRFKKKRSNSMKAFGMFVSWHLKELRQFHLI